MKKIYFLTALPLIILAITLSSCSGDTASGSLEFYANGEDFIRQGFTSKDGWSIEFDHVYITLTNIKAYQTDPPYDPQSDDDISSKSTARLYGVFTVDLAEGSDNAPPILVGKILDVPIGHYNAISWDMVKAKSGPADGYSLRLIGTAQKKDQIINFDITIDEECTYQCGEYVGEERKGILSDGKTADLEMTFHFDHIFGDAELSVNDELNIAAIGFEPFANGLQSADVINMSEMHLGHVGEGHCDCSCS